MSVGDPGRETGAEGCMGKPGYRSRYFAADYTGLQVIKPLSISHGLRDAIDAAARGGAVLHSHGLWQMPTVYPGRAAARHNCPLIVAPRGTLGAAALKFSAGKKRLFWMLAQKRAFEAVNCFHATAWQEVEDIRAYGLTAPVAVIPNGIDVPDSAGEEEIATGRQRTLLYLGRLHPKKGIDLLLHAWSKVETTHGDWHLRIVGPSEGTHSEELQGLAEHLGIQRVSFDGSLFGKAKETAYREADLFVLPTRNENFGMVVAEALAVGTPAIVSKGAPWQGLKSENAGWWTDMGVDPLVAALNEALESSPETLAKMGANGRDWMIRDFSWDKIGADMATLYNWLVKGGEIPAFVQVDQGWNDRSRKEWR
jgi:glycosyltransferase involved in cell wall biosynthesis